MEQDCTGSRESRDILKVKRDVDNAECSHSPQLSVISLVIYPAASKTLQKGYNILMWLTTLFSPG